MLEQRVAIGPRALVGDLALARQPRGLVVFAHGSGSSRLSPRNRHVASALNEQGLCTLLFDLLDEQEAGQRHNVFDVPMLAARLEQALDWIDSTAAGPQPGTSAGGPSHARHALPDLHDMPVGLFGASTGAAAALVAAARRPRRVSAVVSRGGRPDLAVSDLPKVRAPTLLIVGGEDFGVVDLNRAAFAELTCPKALEIVPGATHLFEEPGALEAVAQLAADWFVRHLGASKL